jgi:hypothetical protein
MKMMTRGLLRYGSGGIAIFLLIELFQTAAAKFLFEESIGLTIWQKGFTIIIVSLLIRVAKRKLLKPKETKIWSLKSRFAGDKATNSRSTNK